MAFSFTKDGVLPSDADTLDLTDLMVQEFVLGTLYYVGNAPNSLLLGWKWPNDLVASHTSNNACS